MQMTKRRWAVAVAATGTFALAGWAVMPKPIEVDVARVVRGPLTVSISEDAITRVRERYDVTAPVAGRLLRVLVHAGDAVARGAIVARIEPSPLDPKSEAQLTARVASAERAASEADAMLRRAVDAHRRATVDASRIRTLAQQSIVSRDQLDNATTSESIAAKERQAAKFRAEAARYDVVVARSALNAFDEHGVAREIVVLSPVAGRVLQVIRESESVVAAATPIISIGDPSDLEIVADYLSTDAVKIKPGDRVAIEHWGGPRPLAARVRLVEPSAFMKISALGVEEQRVNVIADFLEPPLTLGDQYRVDSRVIVWEGVAVKVPATSVFTSHGAWQLYVVRDKRVRLQPVEIGHIGENEIEVTRGVNAGELVVAHPSDQVRDGIRVKSRGAT